MEIVILLNVQKLLAFPIYLLIFITTVTLEEQLKGRLAAISRCATKPELLPIAHQNLLITQRYFCNMNLLDFNESACECFKKLRQQKINIGTQDLRIAAIALVNDAILVTQNYKDFIKVPDLKMEDWTVNI